MIRFLVNLQIASYTELRYGVLMKNQDVYSYEKAKRMTINQSFIDRTQIATTESYTNFKQTPKEEVTLHRKLTKLDNESKQKMQPPLTKPKNKKSIRESFTESKSEILVNPVNLENFQKSIQNTEVNSTIKVRKSGFYKAQKTLNELNLLSDTKVTFVGTESEVSPGLKPKVEDWQSVIPDCEKYMYVDYIKREAVRVANLDNIRKRFGLCKTIIPDTEYIYNANKIWRGTMNSSFAETFNQICSKIPFYLDKLKKFEETSVLKKKKGSRSQKALSKSGKKDSEQTYTESIEFLTQAVFHGSNLQLKYDILDLPMCCESSDYRSISRIILTR